MTFISRFFDFRIISETLNSRTSTRAVFKAYCNSLLARLYFRETTNSRILAKIKFSRIFPDLQYLHNKDMLDIRMKKFYCEKIIFDEIAAL